MYIYICIYILICISHYGKRMRLLVSELMSTEILAALPGYSKHWEKSIS